MPLVTRVVAVSVVSIVPLYEALWYCISVACVLHVNCILLHVLHYCTFVTIARQIKAYQIPGGAEDVMEDFAGRQMFKMAEMTARL